MTKMLTPSDIADKLNIHPNTVRDYLKAGILPAVKLGRVWRVEEKDLNNWIEKRKTGARKE